MIADAPIIKALPEVGQTWDDPSEDLLFMLFEDIERGEGTFLIVERIGDPSGQTFAQAVRGEDGSYVVEHREGGPDRHYGTVAPDMRAAHELPTGWAFDVDGWRERAAWSLVT